jgi:hypothetical protein
MAPTLLPDGASSTGLAEITERRGPALGGTTRGGDTTGLHTTVAGFAALDLPTPTTG